MKIRNCPTDEVFTLIYGKFEITDEDGSVVVMNPGETTQPFEPVRQFMVDGTRF